MNAPPTNTSATMLFQEMGWARAEEGKQMVSMWSANVPIHIPFRTAPFVVWLLACSSARHTRRIIIELRATGFRSGAHEEKACLQRTEEEVRPKIIRRAMTV